MPTREEQLYPPERKVKIERMIRSLEIPAYDYVSNGLVLYGTALIHAREFIENEGVSPQDATMIVQTIVSNVILRELEDLTNQVLESGETKAIIPFTYIGEDDEHIEAGVEIVEQAASVEYFFDGLQYLTNAVELTLRSESVEELKKRHPEMTKLFQEILEEMQE